jgi:hypothetical protein
MLFGVLLTLLIVAILVALGWLVKKVFTNAVQAALGETQGRVFSLEKHERLIWDVAMQRAFEKLHHSDQPAFDKLLENFRSHRLTEQQLTQFIERLEVLVTDKRRSERIPAANLLLESALLEREARAGFFGFIDTAEDRAENVLAGNELAREAGDQKSE